MLFARDSCPTGNDYDDSYMGARISSVFVILVTSSFGVFLPILSSRYSIIRLPHWVFFGAKYFGGGVILATGFIHLLAPSNKYLTSECLSSGFKDYPWAYAIALLALFTIFFIEVLAFHLVDRKIEQQCTDCPCGVEEFLTDDISLSSNERLIKDEEWKQNQEAYYGQLVSTFILEFGIIFHSIFIGLTLAVSGEEFKTFYIVLIFHQAFEGLGLGTRVSTTVWPADKQWLPYFFGACYGLTTPLAIAVGLGVRTSYPPGSSIAIITRGIFDSFCAGVLIYSGIVEMMAHEFLFCDEFKGTPGRQYLAYLLMCAGVGLMALLGYWI